VFLLDGRQLAWYGSFLGNSLNILLYHIVIVILLVALGVVVVIVLAVGPRFACSNPYEHDRFLRAIKIRSTTTSICGEVKPSVSCRKILRHAQEPYEHEINTL
jgi:hypothetical protein